MPIRTRRHVWSLAGTVLAGVTLLAVAPHARAASPADSAGPAWALSDDGHLLTGRQRAALGRSLRDKAVECGSPLSILLVPRLPRREALDDLARRTFISERLDAPGPPRVLLVVAVHERQAAIETGQGPAGIVPEIDARRITDRLESALAHRGLGGVALDDAVAAIAASARATAERRRPSPAEPLPPEARPSSAQVDPAGVIEQGADASEGRTSLEGSPAKASGTAQKPATSGATSGDRSLMPAAYVLAAFIVVGLALRRRRRLAEDRVTPPRRPEPPGAKRDRDVKSVGERPRS